LITLVVVWNASYAQTPEVNQGEHRLGITYSSFGDNDVIRFQSLAGAASYNEDSFFSVGLNYLYAIQPGLYLETGLEYSAHSMTIFPNVPPGSEIEPYPTSLSLIGVPLTVRAVFWKYLFLNGGLLLDFQTASDNELDSQTGIGGLLGLGLNYDFKFGGSVFVNPYLKAHALVPFTNERYPQRLMETGIRMGITYAWNSQ
ncbi:MAG: hypothetical protein AAFQ98_24635, partial [Bacteroidota bacterium]